MVKFLIHRPIAVTMTFLALVLIGIATTIILPVSLMPDINIPVVSVRISSADLPARQLENTVVKPVRQLLKEVNHVEEIASETRDGSAWIELRFRHGTPIDLASVEVNEKVDKAMNFLPREITRPEVVRASASDIPVFYLMVTQKEITPGPMMAASDMVASATPTRREYLLDLSSFTSQVIRKRLEQLPEVALIDMSGMQYPEIKITPNPAYLQNGSLTIGQLEQALLNNNIDLGNLLIRDGQYQYNIRFNTRLHNIADIENIPISLNADYSEGATSGQIHRVMKLKDLAQINLQPRKQQGNVTYNSAPAISMAIIKQSDAKVASLEKELESLISHFRTDYPDLEFSVTRDQSKLLKYSISNLGQSLLAGGLLAFLAMFLFLRERKAPWLIGISIPVSLLISLLLFYLTGLSINIISLSGLVLGVGMMIDNSIIVIDNITQHHQRRIADQLETGKSFSETIRNHLDNACTNGTNEVIRPLISSVLTTCAVFVPLIFMKGMAGALFFDQAVAVSIGLVVSLIVSITLLPALYRLIYLKGNKDIVKNKRLPVYFHWYESGLKFVLRHGFITILFVIAMLVSAIFLWNSLPVSRFPEISQNEINLKIDWNEPITLEENNTRLSNLMKQISEQPQYIIEEAGKQQYLLNNAGNAGTSENSLFIQCANPRDLETVMQEIENVLTKNYPEAGITFHETENLFNLAFGKSEAPLVIKVTHFNPASENYLAELSSFQREVEQHFGNGVASELITRDLILLETDPEKLLFYNIDPNELYREIKSAFNVNVVLTINSSNMYVPVSLGNSYNSVYDIIQNITIRNRNNENIPLAGLVKVSSGTDLKTIAAGKDGEFFPVLMNIDPKEYKQVTQEVKNISGKYASFDINFGGSILANRDMLWELALIICISLLLLYFILAAQFESFSLPLIVLLEVPVNLFGVFLFLKIFGAGINIMSAIGIIVMAGIVINDSILKIDTINKSMDAGNSLLRSIFDAGRRRLKPILMTSLTTILAMAPFMFQESMGAGLQKPLALAIIGGMILGTMVSLYFIPLMYYLLKRNRRFKVSS